VVAHVSRKVPLFLWEIHGIVSNRPAQLLAGHVGLAVLRTDVHTQGVACDFVAADDDVVGHPVGFCLRDALADRLVAVVDVGADPRVFEFVDEVVTVGQVFVGIDRDESNLCPSSRSLPVAPP